MKTEDAGPDLYELFVERHFETGSEEIPGHWPEDVRERCIFYLRALESGGVPPLSRIVEADDVEESSPALPTREPRSTERYVVERELARGGMGCIFIAYDRELRRRIAMKVLPQRSLSNVRSSRFLEEAQATAQLEHPNIGPVYDAGIDATRSPFFTMKWIRGRNLEEVLRTGEGELTLIRLVQILQQAAMGVGFAHSKGVVHRDLKPQNIMIGGFGEVLVVDWGLAKILRREPQAGGEPVSSGPVDREADPISTERVDRGVVTLSGSIQGSVPYMAPEQARGQVEEIDARTDVFGLGAILYRILSGSPLYAEPDFDAALARARRCDVVPPSRRPAGTNVPRELEVICLKATAARKEDRYQSALELHDALQRYVEGINNAERRAQEAERLLVSANAMLEELRAAESLVVGLERSEEALRASVPDHASEDVKAPLWDLVTKKRAGKEGAAELFANTTAAYGAVLRVDPGNSRARGALVEIYAKRLADAEERGDLDAARLYEGLARQHGGNEISARLSRRVAVKIETDPPGAEAWVSRYEEKGMLLVESEPERIGNGPVEYALPRGSYLLLIRKPGWNEVRYPVLVDRRESIEARIQLHRTGSIPEGFIQIPAGESIIGGDREQFLSLPRSRPWVRDFFVATFPVTFAEYCEFLSERCRGMGAEDPLIKGLLPFFGKEIYAVRGEDGVFVPASRLQARMPVMAIPYTAMTEYCAWLGGRIHREVRLLEDAEWERCSRGADGRIYPWGNQFDWALAKGGRTREGEPFLEPVGTFPRDCSPFGVRDLAGCIREACPGRDAEGYGFCRGGSWFQSYAFVFRADARQFYAPKRGATDIGFRVCFTK